MSAMIETVKADALSAGRIVVLDGERWHVLDVDTDIRLGFKVIRARVRRGGVSVWRTFDARDAVDVMGTSAMP